MRTDSERRCEDERNAARLTEFERRLRIAVDECFLDRSLSWQMRVDDLRQAFVQLPQAVAESQRRVGSHNAAGHKDQPRANGFNNAPAHVAETRVDPDNANRRL